MEKPIRRILFTNLAFLLLFFTTRAQTTLIDPAGDGGFESGATFATNNWVEVNGSQANKWFVGTAATGYTGARCAYVGTTSANNNYDKNTSAVVHFYRDVTFPAGQPNVTLTFSWKGYGESGYDYLRVYLVPTTTTPASGTLLATGQIGGDFNLTNTWQSATLALPCNLAGSTRRLVFSWRNDASLGSDPAACLDNVSLVSSATASCLPYLGTGVTMVPSLPYNSGAGSTCGQGNDLTSANTATCGSTNYLTGEDQVWIFTPTTSGQVTVSLNAPTASYTGLMLYDDCPITTSCGTGSATCIAYSQSSGGSRSFCVNVISGKTYYLVLDSWTAPSCNNYNSVTISAVTTGINGATCATAVNIGSLPYSVTNQTTTCTGNDYTGSTAGICQANFAFGEDKVYALTVSSAICIGISITNATNNDIGFFVYQGCPGSGGTCIGGSGGSTAGSISTSVNLPGAGTYYLIIDTRSPSVNVNYDLDVISYGAGAPNDRPYQAQALPFNISVAGDNNCSGNADEPAAQPSCFAPSGSNPMNTVWYSFIAPASGCVKIRTTLGTLANTQIAVYGPISGTIAAGSGSTLVLRACNQDLPPCGDNTYPSSELSLTGLTVGMTYYIMVDGYANQTGSFTIFIMDSGPGGTLPFPPAPGQDCALAFPVCKTNIVVPNPGPQAVGNICEFSSNINCLLSGERGSYWYKIQITANGFLEFDIVPNDWPGAPSTNGTDYDFAVWRTKTAGVPGPANCSNLASVAPVKCNYSYLGVTGCYSATNGTAPAAYPGFGAAYQSRIAVTAGDEYLLNVSNYTNSTSGFTLNFPASAPLGMAPPSGGTLVWTGTLSTDWYNVENWGGCAVPNCIYNVTISPVPSNQPSVTGITAVCGSLDIPLDATLTLQPNSQLKVCSNFVNNGTLNAMSNSTVLMQSDSVLQNQSMTGNMNGINRLWNLSINKPLTAGGNTVTLNNDLENAGNFTVGTSATYQGGIFNANGKYHKVGGNFAVFYSSAPYSVYTPGTGTLEFNGTAGQNYFNRESLYDVKMNHTGTGVVLGNSGATDWMSIAGTLSLGTGNLVTAANRVSVTNAAPGAVNTGNTTSFVQGNLKRAFAPTGGTYDFPVGTSTKGYQRIQFNFGSFNDRTDATVNFNNVAPATPVPFLGPECVSATFDQLPLNNGYWLAAATPSTGVAPYTVTAFNTNFTNPQLGYTVMIKNGAGAWLLDGTCVPPSPITAVQRTSMGSLGSSTSFAIAQALTPLPVELLYLTATPNSKSIIVDWATASESHNRGFEILRSENPPDFHLIGWQDGMGNSSDFVQYLFTDHDVVPDRLYYYKLRQVDFDGHFEFTDVVAARIPSSGFTVKAQPNPFSNQTIISLLLSEYAEVTIEIYSSVGQLVARPAHGLLDAGNYAFPFGSGEKSDARGVYTAVVRVNDHTTHLRLMHLE